VSITVGEGGGGGPGPTLTVTDWLALPPAPLQVKLNVPVDVSGPVLCVPVVAFAPDHAPEAVQVLAFVDDQLKVASSPALTEAGFALRETVGAGGGSPPSTSTVTERLVVPPGPVQDRIKTLVVVSGPTVSLPMFSFSPNQAPEAWQEVALRTDQSSVDEPLLSTDSGLAVSDMTGA
jgi:hypothetical protein